MTKFLLSLLVVVCLCMPAKAAFAWQYNVQSGDSWEGIAELTQCSLEELKAANAGITDLAQGGGLNIPDFISASTVTEEHAPVDLTLPTQNEPIVPYTEADLNLLARCVYAEAGGEKYEGQVAVAAVVLNRVLNPNFPDTIREVIYEKRQFECVTNGMIDHAASDSSYKAALAALYGADNTYGALYFWAPALVYSKYHESLNYICKIGCHIFASE